MPADHLAAGVHDAIPADVYHADPCAGASLTASTIKTLLTQTPLHAWTNSRRLNPAFERVEEAKFDRGTVAHEMVLCGDDIAHVVHAQDWRTKEAKLQRDHARATGKIPLLAKDWTRTRAMVSAIHVELADRTDRPALFAAGKPEQTIIWEEHGVLCRARLDWLHDDHSTVDDLKTCGTSANPHDWSRRTFWQIGADIQAVFYQRGVRALTGRTPDFRYVVVESQPPHALAVVSLAPSVVELANRKIDYAIGVWRDCLARNEWPGYDRRVASVEVDSWQEADFLSRTWTEELAA